MPIPAQRDQEQSRKQLATWFAGALGVDGDVHVSELRGPGSTGFSNETIILDVTWTAGSQEQTRTYVVRVAPTGYSLFPEADFDQQWAVLQALGEHTGVPVPTVRFQESDPAVLGAPFYVMDEVVGVVPTDNPPYHVGGWLHDVSPEHRAKIWWGAVDTIAQVHDVDWQGLGLGWLADPSLGEPGLPMQLAYYERWLEAVEEHEPVPAARKALAWLKAHLPTDEQLVLSWGDARIGNVMYDDAGGRVAVLDWEMVSLGPPEMDLAWTLFIDRHHSEGCEVPRLEGFPSKADTIARYEAARGVTLTNMDFYEVFASFRFCVIMAKLAIIFKDWGLLPAEDAMARDNTVTRLIETVLAEREA